MQRLEDTAGRVKKAFVLAVVVALFSTSVQATLDSSDHFNYTVGNTLVSTANWHQAGPSSSTTPKIASGNLRICGFAAASGASVSFGGNGESARRPLASSYYGSGSQIFYSFILKITDITDLSASGAFFAGFNNSTGSQSTTPTVVTTRLYAKKSGSGYVLGVGVDDSGIGYDSTVHYVNETLFIVGCYTYGSSPTSDYSRLWINPDASSFGASSAPSYNVKETLTSGWSGGSDDTIWSFVLLDRASNEPATMIFDELYFGTTWADVTPTGSPSLAISSVSSVNVTGCNGGNNGSITVTPTDGFGPGPLQFSDNNGSTWFSGANSYTFSSLTAGNYNIKVKDANGDCTAVSYSGNPVTITEPTAVTISAVTVTNISCYGGSNGSIKVAASGGTGALQFSDNGGASWSAGTSPYTFSGLSAGSNYNIRVKDANSCTVVYSGNPVAITQPPVLTVSAVAVTNVTCHGAGNGSIRVTVSGGAGEP